MHDTAASVWRIMRRPAALPLTALLIMVLAILAPIFHLGGSMIGMDIIFILPLIMGVVFIASIIHQYARGIFSGILLLLATPLVYAALVVATIWVGMRFVP